MASDVVAASQGSRFSGHESRRADGQLRWLGHRSTNRASVEIVGDPLVTEISVKVLAGSRGGRLVAQLLNMYAPGSLAFFGQAMDGVGAHIDQRRAWAIARFAYSGSVAAFKLS
jgi:hypothetical protein